MRCFDLHQPLIWIRRDAAVRPQYSRMGIPDSFAGELRLPLQFLTSLGIGLLIGLERQRNPTAKAGLRTCALVALLGTVSAMLSALAGAPWILAAGLAAVAAMIIVAYAGHDQPEADSGTTTVVAVILCYVFGAMVWLGELHLAVTLAIATTVLLHFKTELHGFTERLAPHDVSMVLQLAVLSFIVLPLLPDAGYGPYRALNPHNIWLMVVLVSGLGLGGYLALRVIGARRGLLLLGLFGGLVSSTATTFVYARQAAAREELGAVSAAVIALANLVVPMRLLILVLVVAPEIALKLLPALGLAVAFGVYPALSKLGTAIPRDDATVPGMSNPASLRVALGFGLLYAAVLLLAAWVSNEAGERGLLVVAAVSGLVDVDAITLSSLQLYNTGAVAELTAGWAVVVAFLTASIFKLSIVAWTGGSVLMRHTWLSVVAPMAGAMLGTALL